MTDFENNGIPDQISIVLKGEDFGISVKATFYDRDLAIRYAEIIEGWVDTSVIQDAYEKPTLSTRTKITAGCSKRAASDKSNASAEIYHENDLDDGLENLPRTEYSVYDGVQCVSLERRFITGESEALAKKEMRKLAREYLTQAMKLREEGYDTLKINALIRKHFFENLALPK